MSLGRVDGVIAVGLANEMLDICNVAPTLTVRKPARTHARTHRCTHFRAHQSLVLRSLRHARYKACMHTPFILTSLFILFI